MVSALFQTAPTEVGIDHRTQGAIPTRIGLLNGGYPAVSRLRGHRRFILGQGFSWIDCSLLLGMYALTARGITERLKTLLIDTAFLESDASEVTGPILPSIVLRLVSTAGTDSLCRKVRP
jgi:hypothetical protein